MALPSVLSPTEKDAVVTIPEVYGYDAQNHILRLQDGGAWTLKDAYADLSLDVQALRRALGAWLAQLHAKTSELRFEIGDNVTAKAIYRHSYSNLAATATRYGLDAALGERIDKTYGALLQHDNECFCHGDFLPGNVIVGGDSKARLMVVDWEMVRRGCGATDVGQFAAEAWLLDRFRGGRGLLPAFLEGYRKTRGEVGGEWFKRVTVHMGAHLGFWPSRVRWGDEGETRECVVLGREIMGRAEGADLAWFSEGEGRLLRALVGGGLGDD